MPNNKWLRAVDGGPGAAVASPAELAAGGGTIEIEFATGARMRITGAVDQAMPAATTAAIPPVTAYCKSLPTKLRIGECYCMNGSNSGS